MYTLLKNAKIYDGTGAEPFFGDVLIEQDKIAKVGAEITAPDTDTKTIDLSGLSLSSGFIDAHSHNDWYAIKKQPLKYFEPFIRQGISSFVTGNCGISSTGFNADSKYIDKIGGGLFSFSETTGRYGSIAELFDAVDGKNPCNIAACMGHCSARAGVAGNENRPLSADERKRMLETLEQGLKDGACGLSLGLMYEPGLYAPRDELEDVAKLCLKYDRPLTVHPRANSAVSMAYPELLGRPHLLRALDELAEIAKGTKLKLQYSHAIFVGRKSFKCKDELIEIIERMRREGVDAQFDIYNELLGVSVITVIMPTWYQALSPEEKRKRINKLRFRILARASIILLGFDYDDIEIAYLGEGNERFEGKTVHQIAKELGKSDFETYLSLCEMSNFAGRVNVGPYSTPEIISSLSKHENVLYMTDAWVEDHGIQNPALYDNHPKFLRSSLLGTGDTMPNTIRKMTGAVADRFALKDRGYIKPGCFADITVFNEDELKNATPDLGRPFGIERLFINGRQVLEDGKLDTEALKTSGRAMRAE